MDPILVTGYQFTTLQISPEYPWLRTLYDSSLGQGTEVGAGRGHTKNWRYQSSNEELQDMQVGCEVYTMLSRQTSSGLQKWILIDLESRIIPISKYCFAIGNLLPR